MSSSPNTPPKFIHVTAVTVSLELDGRSKRLNSGELHIGPHRHLLMCDNGKLCQKFQNVAIELTPDTRITLRYRTSLLSLRKKVQVDTDRLFASFSAGQAQDFELSLSYGIQVVFSCRAANTIHVIPENTGHVSPATRAHEASTPTTRADGALTPTTRTDRALTPTTDAIFKDHPRFRILVIGKSGVGKSSLIGTAFGIDNVYTSDFVRGGASIEKGLESVVNKRFILHDSLGFEAADSVNYDTVKQFIQSRQRCAPEDKLHAVWFCVPVPRAGGRLLEAAAEDFFRTKKEIMGTIPIIVVYTKIDVFVDERTMKLAKSSPQFDEENVKELAFSEARSGVEVIHKEIDEFAGESLPYEVVSTKAKYKYTIQQLIKLTSDQVGAHDAPEAQITSGITLTAAQRVDPNLKIKGTIDVGRQKYWKTLRASSVFDGNTIWDCFSVIHSDIVAIWNFNDPDCHLSDKNFKELVAKMAVKVGAGPVPKPSQKVLESIRNSLMVAILEALGNIPNPEAPIVFPVVKDFASAMEPYGVYYRSAKNVQQLFIAYIVDLTHILETLAILTARDHKKLTRRIIKLAYYTYGNSGLMTQAHGNIQKYRELEGRDAALEMIENSIKPERYGDPSLRNYYTEISKLDLGRFKLDQEEEW